MCMKIQNGQVREGSIRSAARTAGSYMYTYIIRRTNSMLTGIIRILGRVKQLRDGVGNAMEDKVVDENAPFNEHCDDLRRQR